MSNRLLTCGFRRTISDLVRAVFVLLLLLVPGGAASAADPGSDSQKSSKASDHPFSPEVVAKAAQWKAPHAPEEGGIPGIRQGPYSDSWFQSSVGALVRTAQGRQQICSIISQNSPGRYIVRFPGRPSSAVSVKDVQIASAKLQNKADWANVLEFAVGKLYPQVKNVGSGQPHEGESGLTLLTGTPTNVVKLSEQNSEKISSVLDVLDRCLRDSAPVITTRKGQKATAGKSLALDQTFAVVAYDRKGKTITLWSPLGDALHSRVGPGTNAGTPGKADQSIGDVTNLGGGNVKMSIQSWIDTFAELSYASLPT